MQLVAGELGATEDEPDLGAVAVGDHDPVALVEQAEHRPHRLQQRLVLVLDLLVAGVMDQRVAADGHDHGADVGAMS